MFLNKKDLKLDQFQRDAIDAVMDNFSVLVSAPTGTGKTLIAQYLIEKCLVEGRGVIYTAPIKALSNQKFREFQVEFPGQVGIITGDISINPNAPLLIMTTEIFRNRILESNSGLEDHSWVIFDEIHYLDDLDRGTVWEESLIFLPPQMRFIGLSATIPNIEEFAGWLNEIHSHSIKVIREDYRPVPLHFSFQCFGKILANLHLVKKLGFGRRKVITHPELDSHSRKTSPKNSPSGLIRHLLHSQRLPAIYFCFSRKRCEYLAEKISNFEFLKADETRTILKIYDNLCQKFNISSDLRSKSMRTYVARGVAYHHAGIHPMLKEVIERLFTGKYIKIIFTTETFALGINMPARTVIIDELRKRYGRFFRVLKVRDFFQMAGRAGRRGIDKQGYVYSRINPLDTKFSEIKTLFNGQPEPVKSKFNISYATILNLYELYGEGLMKVYSLSFHSYQEKDKPNSVKLEQIKSRLKILKRFGYIQAGKLTQKAHFAKNIYGYEIPITELYNTGILESFTPVELGIFSLAAVFEPRPRMKKPVLKNESKKIKKLISKTALRIIGTEKKFGISPVSKNFYFDLSDSLRDWMAEKSFESILNRLDIDEGEVIRYFRMSIQVLKEIKTAPISDLLREKLNNAIHLINRDVIDAEQELRTSVSLELG